MISLEIYITAPCVCLESAADATSDPILVCEALRQQNDALRQELHDIRRVSTRASRPCSSISNAHRISPVLLLTPYSEHD